MENKKRYAVLLCAEDSEYVKKLYGGYFGVYLRLLGEEGETWHLYRVTQHEFPNDDEINMFDGFVITGSCSDAFSNDVWIRELVCFIKKLDSLKKKVLGICFGHQILSRAIGGKVSRAASGWSIGVASIQISSTSSKFLQTLQMPNILPILEVHRDEVWELPPKAEVMAWSDNTKVEMFKYGDHILGIQGHPEYTNDILLNIIDRLVERDLLTESIAEKAREVVNAGEPDREAWRRLCISFLKGGL